MRIEYTTDINGEIVSADVSLDDTGLDKWGVAAQMATTAYKTGINGWNYSLYLLEALAMLDSQKAVLL